MSEEDIIQTTLRIPRGLHARLKKLSDKEKRSLNSQLLVLIEEALSDTTTATNRSNNDSNLSENEVGK